MYFVKSNFLKLEKDCFCTFVLVEHKGVNLFVPLRLKIKAWIAITEWFLAKIDDLSQHNSKQECSKKEEGKCASNANFGTACDQARIAGDKVFTSPKSWRQPPCESCLQETGARKDKDEDCGQAAEHVDHCADVGDLDGEDHRQDEPGCRNYRSPHLGRAIRDGWRYQNGWIFGKGPSEVGVIFNFSILYSIFWTF